MMAVEPSSTSARTSFTPVVAPPLAIVAPMVGSASPGLSATAGAVLTGTTSIVTVPAALWLLWAEPEVSAGVLGSVAKALPGSARSSRTT